MPQVTNEEGDNGKVTRFYLNLCRPLVPMHGINCPAGSWACWVEGNQVTFQGHKLKQLILLMVAVFNSPHRSCQRFCRIKEAKGSFCIELTLKHLLHVVLNKRKCACRLNSNKDHCVLQEERNDYFCVSHRRRQSREPRFTRLKRRQKYRGH